MSRLPKEYYQREAAKRADEILKIALQSQSINAVLAKSKEIIAFHKALTDYYQEIELSGREVG